jgi:DNA-directed RNA polymerase subunit M/transcription elongation factor TFIIS
MTLEFCPVCKKLLQLRKENEIIIGFCNCGFTRNGVDIASSDETIKNNLTKKAQGITPNLKESGFFHKCSKCNYEEAEVIDLGETSDTETTICLFKCKNCNNVDREKR